MIEKQRPQTLRTCLSKRYFHSWHKSVSYWSPKIGYSKASLNMLNVIVMFYSIFSNGLHVKVFPVSELIDYRHDVVECSPKSNVHTQSIFMTCVFIRRFRYIY